MFSARKFVNAICILAFFLSLIIYIYLSFEAYRMDEIALAMGFETGNSAAVSLFKSITQLTIVLTSIFFFHFSCIKLKGLGILFFIIAAYFAFHTIFSTDIDRLKAYVNQFTTMSLWIYIYLFFYTLFSKINVNPKQLHRVTFFFIIYFFVLFLNNYTILQTLQYNWAFIESYFLITLIPFAILFNNKKTYFFLIVIGIAVLLAGKRTGTVAFVLSIITFYLFRGNTNILGKIKNTFYLIFISAAFYLIATSFFPEQLANVVERFENISEDGGSGRDSLFENVYNKIDKSEGTDLWLGHGYNAVVKLPDMEYSAHNEFLETAYDYGIVGFIMYSSIFILLLIKCFTLRNSTLRVATVVSLTSFFIISLTSHTILYTTSIMCLCAFWGFIDSRKNQQQSLFNA